MDTKLIIQKGVIGQNRPTARQLYILKGRKAGIYLNILSQGREKPCLFGLSPPHRPQFATTWCSPLALVAWLVNLWNPHHFSAICNLPSEE
jgi:hypothetical protein